MAFCVKCGKMLPEGAEFCPNCGEAMKETKPKKEKPRKEATAPAKPEKLPVPKTTKFNLPVLLGALVVLVIAIVAVVILVLPSLESAPVNQTVYQAPTDIEVVEVCEESWVCGPWSECNNSIQTRECVDQNHCGSNEQGIITNRPCTETLKTFCGDGNCDKNENCGTCPDDCGGCFDDEENVFTEPIYYNAEKEYKEQGYAVVKYFYTPECVACVAPIDLAAELEDLAEEFKGLMILIEIDSSAYPDMAKTQAKVGGVVYVPFIKIEGFKDGVHGYTTIYGVGLERRLDDFSYSIAQEICERIDGCYYDSEGVMHRT